MNPRAEIAHSFELTDPTAMPGTSRSASAMLVTPERWISSFESTVTAEAVSDSFCSRFETEVTVSFINSSKLRFPKSVSAANNAAPHGTQTNHAARRLHRPALKGKTCSKVAVKEMEYFMGKNRAAHKNSGGKIAGDRGNGKGKARTGRDSGQSPPDLNKAPMVRG